ncbi:UNVERIFIED_CONTAM: hypothetical protein Slati_0081900 [Sesamum latifolium]|uniref:Uncharacterized protein n=1 Tax=Sesamum latifolium TaxID=2727402 RepID=A0AAW2Y818_9LAMI
MKKARGIKNNRGRWVSNVTGVSPGVKVIVVLKLDSQHGQCKVALHLALCSLQLRVTFHHGAVCWQDNLLSA